MKIFLLLTFLMLVQNVFGQRLAELRALYGCVGIQEDSARKMFSLLKPVTEVSEPLLLCYKGAVTMVLAKYYFNPLIKYGYFKRGKKLVEKAISRDSANIEMRYLRFTLQSNLPAFLGYSSQLKTDKDFLANHCLLVTDAALQGIIISLLLASKYCNSENVKKLQHAGRSSISR